MFKLTKEQEYKIDKWLETKDLSRYCGVSGGRFTYQFTPTTLGLVVQVLDNLDKTSLDVSDYEEW